jgi:hypothetical protein
MAHSSHKQWRGHCMMCATLTGKINGVGQRERLPFRDQRHLGKSRRLMRHDVQDRGE